MDGCPLGLGLVLEDKPTELSYECIEFTAVERSSEYFASLYDDQVIYIEVYAYRGYWLRAFRENTEVLWLAQHQDDVADNLELKWHVTNVGGGQVNLENLKFKRNYLDTHLNGAVKNTFSSFPHGVYWAMFKIEERNSRFYLHNVYTTEQPYVSVELCNTWLIELGIPCTAMGRFREHDCSVRIYIQEKEDYFHIVAILDNIGEPVDREFQYQEEIGISKTNGQEISSSIESQIGVEIKGAFSFGLSHSTEWRSFSDETYSRKVTYTVTTSVPAGTLVRVLQLAGTYGSFLVNARYFKFETEYPAANIKNVAYASGMKEYNSGEFLPEPVSGKLIN